MKTINGTLYLKTKRVEWYQRTRSHVHLTIENGDILQIPVHQLREIIAKEKTQ